MSLKLIAVIFLLISFKPVSRSPKLSYKKTNTSSYDSKVSLNYLIKNKIRLKNAINTGNKQKQKWALNTIFLNMPSYDIKKGIRTRFRRGLGSSNHQIRNRTKIELINYLNKLIKR